MTIEEIKIYLRVDGSEEDALVQGLQAAAISYLQSTTGRKYDDTNTLHTLLVKQLVAFWFENRGSNEVKEIPYPIKMLTNQIAMSTAAGGAAM